MGRLLRLLLPADRFEPRDRGITFLTWLAGVAQGFITVQAVNTLPFTRATFGASEADMATLLGWIRLAAIGALLFTVVGDRAGRKPPFLVAFFLMTSMGFATAFSSTATVFAVLQAVTRLAASAVALLAAVMLAEQLRPGIRAYGIAMYGAAASFGAGIGTFMLPLAERSDASWRVLFAAGLLFLGLYPILARRLPESRIFKSEARLDLRAVIFGGESRSFWLLALLFVSTGAFTAVSTVFLFERLIGQLGLTATSAVAISLGGGTLGGIGFFAGGRASDSIGRRPTAVAALLASGAGGLLLYLTDTVPLLVLGAFLAGAGGFAAIPALGSQRSELFETSHRASATTLLNAAGVAGAAAGLWLAGSLIDEVGLSRTVATLAIGIGLAIIIELLLTETNKRVLT